MPCSREDLNSSNVSLFGPPGPSVGTAYYMDSKNALMFWGWILGIWGLLLAVTLPAALKAVCECVDGLDASAEGSRA
jgi:tetrahydromethanopterin S-methyltransferase subunit C